jgi:hypothetical protein
MFLCHQPEGEHICYAVGDVMYCHPPQFAFDVGIGLSCIAVHGDWFVGLPDILPWAWVGNLADRTLVVQQQVILVHHPF